VSAPDGGPAFPWDCIASAGMSLRDYFAAAPMSDVELETLREAYSAKFPSQPLSISRLRYWRADTMLEAREQWYRENQKPNPLVEPSVMQPLKEEPVTDQPQFPEVK